LKALLSAEKSHVSQLERELSSCQERAEQETARLREEQLKLRDRYDRLIDSHRKMQKINNNLEDKFLTVVQKLEGDKQDLNVSINTLSDKLSEAADRIQDLEDDCSRYQSDCSVAVHLLQCKPAEFMSHKLNTLPLDLRDRLRDQLSSKQLQALEEEEELCSETSKPLVRFPLPTFPPIAVYDVHNRVELDDQTMARSGNGVRSSNGVRSGAAGQSGGQDDVPVSVIAQLLSDRPPSRRSSPAHMCIKCRAGSDSTDKSTQTFIKNSPSGDKAREEVEECEEITGSRSMGSTESSSSLVTASVHRASKNVTTKSCSVTSVSKS